MHYTALDIGMLFLIAGAVIQIFLMPLIGTLRRQARSRALHAACRASRSCASSLWLNAHLTDQAGFTRLVMPNFIRSLGLGFIFIPVSVVALSDLLAGAARQRRPASST